MSPSRLLQLWRVCWHDPERDRPEWGIPGLISLAHRWRRVELVAYVFLRIADLEKGIGREVNSARSQIVWIDVFCSS